MDESKVRERARSVIWNYHSAQVSTPTVAGDMADDVSDVWEPIVQRLESELDALDALVRDVLVALCEERGLPTESMPNYQLVLALGIGRVFGL